MYGCPITPATLCPQPTAIPPHLLPPLLSHLQALLWKYADINHLSLQTTLPPLFQWGTWYSSNGSIRTQLPYSMAYPLNGWNHMKLLSTTLTASKLKGFPKWIYNLALKTCSHPHFTTTSTGPSLCGSDRQKPPNFTQYHNNPKTTPPQISEFLSLSYYYQFLFILWTELAAGPGLPRPITPTFLF